MNEHAIDKFADVTQLIYAHRNGDDNAYDRAIELLYSKLRAIAHRHRVRLGGNPTMHTTAVVNEAYLKMKKAPSAAEDSAHFLSIAATAMRQIIIDYARSKNTNKRGGDVVHVEFDDTVRSLDTQAEQLLLINDALQHLSAHNARLAKVFECKFFAGLEHEELALALGLTKRTAQRDWMKARAFMSEYLAGK